MGPLRGLLGLPGIRQFRSLRARYRRAFALFAAAGVALGAGLGVWAYYSSIGSGQASATIATLQKSSITNATAGAGTVSLQWSAITPPAADIVSYYVTRDGGIPGGDCPAASTPSAVTSCTDGGLGVGTHQYTIVALWRTWTSTSSTTSVSVNYGPLDHFRLTATTTTPTAGTADNLTVTAQDVGNNTVGNYTGSQQLTFGGAGTIGANTPTVADRSGIAVSFGTLTSITFTNGVATVSSGWNGVMTLYKAETAAISVSDGSHTNGAGLTVTVSAGAAASFSMSAVTTALTAGAGDNLTITAKDAYGNTAISYTGSKNLTFAGATTIGTFHPTVTNSLGTAVNFGSTTSTTFTAGVATVSGSSNGVMTLYKAEATSITVAAGAINNGTGLAVTVSPAAAQHFSVPTPAAQTAGVAFNETLTAQDLYGNTATSYTGSQSIVFTGPANAPDGTAPGYPGSVTFAAGVGTASITLYDAQTTTLTATQNTLTGTSTTFTVSPAAASRLAWTSPTVSGGTLPANCLFTCSWSGANKQKFTFKVSVTDAHGNTIQNLGSSPTVTIAGSHGAPASQTGSIPSSGAATTGSSMTYKMANGGWTTDTLTAASGSYTHAVINVTP